jgi:phenylalanyl-tRNA synthetase beta chain
MLRGADALRCSLIPSLLESRRVNESLANETIELFETAKVYLPRAGQLPDEQPLLALTSGRSFQEVKGILEAIVDALHVADPLEVAPAQVGLLDSDGSCQLKLGGVVLGYLGTVTTEGLASARLRKPTTVAELKLDVLQSTACLVPQYRPLSPFPAIAYDFNFVVDESVRWADLAETVRQAGGDCLEQIDYRETYRDPHRDGADRKRLLLSIRLRSAEHTLTGEEADTIHQAIVSACQSRHGAQLLA